MSANPLVENLLDVARHLAQMPGREGLRQAAFRRSVSTAYYALFHQLCFLVADELVGWGRTDQITPIYRLLDHGPVLKVLRSDEARRLAPTMEEIAAIVGDLQDLRRDADYSQPGRIGPASRLLSRTEVLNFIAEADRGVDMLDVLADETKLRLATLLVAQGRRR